MPFTKACQEGNQMKRIMIVGGPGSGKSTLARLLGEKTSLPVFHMDMIHWMPNWEERPRAEKIRLARSVEIQDDWIFGGGLSVTYGERLARADTLIWLDVAVSVRFGRVLKRTFKHWGQARPDLPEGCNEGFTAQTLPFWRWILTTRHSGRAIIANLVDGAGDTTVHELHSLKEVRAFLEKLPAVKSEDTFGGD
jgi:adenylate kinase family enzyme